MSNDIISIFTIPNITSIFHLAMMKIVVIIDKAEKCICQQSHVCWLGKWSKPITNCGNTPAGAVHCCDPTQNWFHTLGYKGVGMMWRRRELCQVIPMVESVLRMPRTSMMTSITSPLDCGPFWRREFVSLQIMNSYCP